MKKQKSELVQLLGGRIRAARENAGKTQTQLALACGWFNKDDTPAQGRLSNYEKGVREPGIDEVCDIAAATSTPLTYFYDLEDQYRERSPRSLEIAELARNTSDAETMLLIKRLSEVLPSDDLVKASAIFSSAAAKSLGDEGT